MVPRFLIAKYVPDLSRMEPRNIGVILWSNGVFSSKFLAEKDATFVNEIPVYRRWVDYWTDLMSRSEIPGPRRRPVPVSDSCCIEVLISTQKGNYILVDSGELLTSVGKRDLPAATNHLFSELVAVTNKSQEELSRSFTRSCSSLFESAGLHVVKRRQFSGRVFGFQQVVRPHYCIGDSTPEAVFHRATLSKTHSVNDAFVTINAVIGAGLNPNQCRVLVRGGEVVGTESSQALSMFNEICGTIDVDNPNAAKLLSEVATAGAKSQSVSLGVEVPLEATTTLFSEHTDTKSALKTLSPVERKVLEAVGSAGKGCTLSALQSQLKISPATISKHLAAVKKKLATARQEADNESLVTIAKLVHGVES